MAGAAEKTTRASSKSGRAIVRVGVLLATFVVLIGGAIHLMREGTKTADRHSFHGEPLDLRRPDKIVEDALRLDASAIIQLGLLILIATPIARVAFSLVAFLWQRDITFALLTLFVLALLIFSMATGTLGG